MGLGFELREGFSGTYYRLDRPLEDQAIQIALHLGVDGIRRFARDRQMQATGTIVADELAASGRPLRGTVAMKLFDERRVPYDLGFEGDDGRSYRLRGQRDFFVHDARSLTVLPASLYDDAGVEIARALMRFDARTELPTFVKSFRPRLRVPLLGERH
ncbi:MAG TPA: hypothetical protein VIF62_22155 [Labilithrix sp.]|jgi:hypothetical protein